VRATHTGQVGDHAAGRAPYRDEYAWFAGHVLLDDLREAYESGLPRALGAAALNV
jgi:hypothetical protein